MYVGKAEENIRNLFKEAEDEQRRKGDDSQLHIIIFDEIDAICKKRGSNKDSTGVGDNIVNQLLTKIDGVDALNNILVIGMTNRIDLIDEALLRSGRMEVHVEVSLPDEVGRVEILNIHTAMMRKEGFLEADVSIESLAARTQNFSGAELEHLVRTATSYACAREVDVKNLGEAKELTSISVTKVDFENAIADSKPMFGTQTAAFENCIERGILSYSTEFDQLATKCLQLVEQVQCSDNVPILKVLVSGAPGCGKTALTAHLARKCKFPFVRRIANENYLAMSEAEKISAITKLFADASKTPLGLIVLDDLECLLDHVELGNRFSTAMFQTILGLLKQKIGKVGRRMIIIGTTSCPDFIQASGLAKAFNVKLTMPTLTQPSHFQAALDGQPGFTTAVIEEISNRLAGRIIGIQTMLLVAEISAERESPVSMESFMECLEDTD